jgi:hypothetical protein
MEKIDDYGHFEARPGDEADRTSSDGARGQSQLPESRSAWARRTRPSGVCDVALIAKSWTIWFVMWGGRIRG